MLFIGATFFTQVTALNMLIAIMGNTFEKVKECAEFAEREMKISILADYIKHIKRKNDGSEAKNQFIVLVTPEDEDGAQSEWEGSVNMIRQTIKEMRENLQMNFN